MKLQCFCCGAKQSRAEAARQLLCPACTAAGCEPAYRPWCQVGAAFRAAHGDLVSMMFMCGPGGCTATYEYAPPVGAPDLQVMTGGKRDDLSD